MPTRGVVYVHSTPLAVCPHVEWAIARVLGRAGQPASGRPSRSTRRPPGRVLGGPARRDRGRAGRCPAAVADDPFRGHRGAQPRRRRRALHARARPRAVPGRDRARPATSRSPRTGCERDGPARGPEALAHALDKALGTRLGRRARAVPARRRRRAGHAAHPGRLSRVPGPGRVTVRAADAAPRSDVATPCRGRVPVSDARAWCGSRRAGVLMGAGVPTARHAPVVLAAVALSRRMRRYPATGRPSVGPGQRRRPRRPGGPGRRAGRHGWPTRTWSARC